MVRRRLTEMSTTPTDMNGSDLEDLDGNPVAVNQDGTITLYHYAPKKSAAAISRRGFRRSDFSRGESFFTTKPGQAATGFGDTLIGVRVLPQYVELDDAFRGGEVHVSVPYKFIRRLSRPWVVEEQTNYETPAIHEATKKSLGPQLPIPTHIKPEYHFLPQEREGWNAGLKYARDYIAKPPYPGQRGKQSMRHARAWLKQQTGEVTLERILRTGYPAHTPPPQLDAAELLRSEAGGKLRRMKRELETTRDARKVVPLREQHIPFWAAVKAVTQHVIDAWTKEPPSPPHIVKWTRAVAEKLLKEWEATWEKAHPPKTAFEARVKRRLRRKMH